MLLVMSMYTGVPARFNASASLGIAPEGGGEEEDTSPDTSYRVAESTADSKTDYSMRDSGVAQMASCRSDLSMPMSDGRGTSHSDSRDSSSDPIAGWNSSDIGRITRLPTRSAVPTGSDSSQENDQHLPDQHDNHHEGLLVFRTTETSGRVTDVGVAVESRYLAHERGVTEEAEAESEEQGGNHEPAGDRNTSSAGVDRSRSPAPSTQVGDVANGKVQNWLKTLKR